MELHGKKAVLALAGVALAAAALGGIGVYLAMNRAETPPAAPSAIATETTEPTTTPSSPATSTASEEPTPSASGESTPPGGTSPSGVVDQPTLVVDWSRTGGRIRLTLDYIQFLTGDAAARAAAERGDESPPPNDYYIVNDNPRLRVFPVRPGIRVRVLYNDDGTMTVEGREISLDEWYARLTGPMADAYSSSYFLVTVQGGEITRIAQQYTP